MSSKTVEYANHLAAGLREIFQEYAEVEVIEKIASDNFRSEIYILLTTTENQKYVMQLIQSAIAGIGLPGFHLNIPEQNNNMQRIGGMLLISNTAEEQMVITTVTAGETSNTKNTAVISVKDYSGNRATAI